MLLDFWKCHLCRHTHYLFLLVPLALRQNPDMSPRKELAHRGAPDGAVLRAGQLYKREGAVLVWLLRGPAPGAAMSRRVGKWTWGHAGRHTLRAAIAVTTVVSFWRHGAAAELETTT